jgi:hypothetical protein
VVSGCCWFEIGTVRVLESVARRSVPPHFRRVVSRGWLVAGFRVPRKTDVLLSMESPSSRREEVT